VRLGLVSGEQHQRHCSPRQRRLVAPAHSCFDSTLAWLAPWREIPGVTTKEFFDAVRSARDRTLVFINADGVAVHAGYHLTEIKAVTYDTVDCGGQRNTWGETILQLWVPRDADDEYMKAGKFVRIFDKVRSLVSSLNDSAPVRVEYGDENFFPSVYSVESVSMRRDKLLVTLSPPETTCKARERRTAGAESCCC
jgi:hypothetical protein